MIFEGNHELPSLEFIEDEGKLKIWGRSISTAAKEDFWSPLLHKLEYYLLEPRDMVVSLSMEFFASSSAKLILDMLRLLEKKCIKNERKVLIKWYYDDDDMLEAGEDYLSIVPKLDWKFIKIEE